MIKSIVAYDYQSTDTCDYSVMCCTYSQVSEVFETEIDVIMKRLGFCCGRKYVFLPNVLVCYGKQSLACTISQYQVYYAYENRYTLCDKCFIEVEGDTVEINDELTGNPLTFPKDKFQKVKVSVGHSTRRPIAQMGTRLHINCLIIAT